MIKSQNYDILWLIMKVESQLTDLFFSCHNNDFNYINLTYHSLRFMS